MLHRNVWLLKCSSAWLESCKVEMFIPFEIQRNQRHVSIYLLILAVDIEKKIFLKTWEITRTTSFCRIVFLTNYFWELGSKFGQDGQIPISREFFKNCHMQINFCEKFSNSFLFLLLRRFRLEMERETKPLKRTYFETCNTSCSNISEISRTGSSLGLLNE